MNYQSKNTPRSLFLCRMKRGFPDAYAFINGDDSSPELCGTAYFYSIFCGTLVEIQVSGIPYKSESSCSSFHGLHIHENGDCTPPFDKTGNHYNPEDAPHPMHAGDMPPLLSNCGYAYSVFYTERFHVKDIIGRSVIIHDMPDDFKTQPSGGSGNKIGCGVIRPYNINSAF